MLMTSRLSDCMRSAVTGVVSTVIIVIAYLSMIEPICTD